MRNLKLLALCVVTTLALGACSENGYTNTPKSPSVAANTTGAIQPGQPGYNPALGNTGQNLTPQQLQTNAQNLMGQNPATSMPSFYALDQLANGAFSANSNSVMAINSGSGIYTSANNCGSTPTLVASTCGSCVTCGCGSSSSVLVQSAPAPYHHYHWDDNINNTSHSPSTQNYSSETSSSHINRSAPTSSRSSSAPLVSSDTSANSRPAPAQQAAPAPAPQQAPVPLVQNTAPVPNVPLSQTPAPTIPAPAQQAAPQVANPVAQQAAPTVQQPVAPAPAPAPEQQGPAAPPVVQLPTGQTPGLSTEQPVDNAQAAPADQAPQQAQLTSEDQSKLISFTGSDAKALFVRLAKKPVTIKSPKSQLRTGLDYQCEMADKGKNDSDYTCLMIIDYADGSVVPQTNGNMDGVAALKTMAAFTTGKDVQVGPTADLKPVEASISIGSGSDVAYGKLNLPEVQGSETVMQNGVQQQVPALVKTGKNIICYKPDDTSLPISCKFKAYVASGEIEVNN